jgi:hypothetical protein
MPEGRQVLVLLAPSGTSMIPANFGGIKCRIPRINHRLEVFR